MDLQIITTDHEHKLPIDARKLYDYLEFSKNKFIRWSKRNIEENDFFFENIDWEKTETILTNGNNFFENKDIEVPTFERNPDTEVVNDDEDDKPSRIKKDYFLSFEMAYHLTIKCDTQKGHDARQTIIKNKKLEFENKRKIAELSTKNQLDKAEIKELKQHSFLINKRLRVLTELVETQERDLHLLNIGVDIKTLPRLGIVQLNLFDNSKKQLEI